jgi:hypothetical protein
MPRVDPLDWEEKRRRRCARKRQIYLAKKQANSQQALIELEKFSIAREHALAEANRRGHDVIVTRTGGRMYVVSWRDKVGRFHFGSARAGWKEAFEDAERRAK